MKTPFVPSDLFSIVSVSDPQIAPDASAVYFRRTAQDQQSDAATGNIWRVGADGTAIAFTSGKNDRLGRISPDGRMLAFVGDRDDQTQLYVMPTNGGEARTVGDALKKLGGLAWSADSKKIACVAQTEHDPQGAKVFHDEKSGARHIRQLPFKSDMDGLLDGTRKHLFVVDVASGTHEQITQGDFDVTGPAWSPDGTMIAFSAAINLPEWSFGSDIHIVTLATKAVRSVTQRNGPMTSPTWSHDGKWIAYFGHEHGDDAGGRFNTELMLVTSSDGPSRSLSAGIDRTVGDAIINDMRSGFAATAPVWSADDREIFVQVSDSGSCHIRAFARDGSGVRDITSGDRDVFGFSLANDGAIAFGYSTPLLPSDIAIMPKGGVEKRLTFVNDEFFKTRIVHEPKRYRPKREDGAILDGWLMVPPGADAQRPLILQVHGGPHAAYGHSFFFEFQILAGTGCAVAYGNPRGGQSYGHAYANAITGDWGGIDADDVHAILDGALALTDVDRKRIGVAGGSYGGFMTTWLLGHSDRFAAGVSMRAVNDFVSEVGASDLGWFLEREMDSPPMLGDGGRKLFEGSPMRAADKIDAPMLVEHSERDYRCPIDQGEQLFTLLRRLGKKQVEFVRFTGDGHELSRGGKPRNRILRLRAIAHWFLRHLKPAGATILPETAGALFAPMAGEPEETANAKS
jgi:dipeptidyl aminopeptidase/acylaminoacyl peptidase